MPDKQPFASAKPFSPREREDEAQYRRKQLRLRVRGRRAAPRGRYDQQGTEKTKEKDLRIMGESL